MPDAEIVVAADGAVEDIAALAADSRARVVPVPGPSGPAVARNRAAAVATGELLVFVDADVVAVSDSIRGMCRLLESNPEIAAVFGAYDRSPAETNFWSQYKNLSHACVHESGNRNAVTFWAGLGAMRRAVFEEVGGFDERFARPSIEDIDLGYRVHRAGHQLRLDPTYRGKHLKRWSLRSAVVTDIQARGIPWTQLIHRYGALANDLNTSWGLRLSVPLSYLFVLGLLMLPFSPRWGASVAVVTLALLCWLNRAYYGWFRRHRGWLFAMRVVPAHVLHHLCNGVSFLIGTAAHLGTRMGLSVPGALPVTDWTARQ